MRVIQLLSLAAVLLLASLAQAAQKPNFVWLLSEDNSKHYLRLFDEGGAPTPNIERLASQGIVFERAFSCSPVCSVARTTLITGVYAPRLGTQMHRKIAPVHLPPGLRMFPAYLRQAGYYATNNAKKDYNAVEGPGVWDESSGRATWRNRPNNETPFFHMHSFGASHESSLHFSRQQIQRQETSTSPEDVAVAPYHPDTETFRYTYARYHDRIGEVDRLVGRMLSQLEEDGLLEDTFVFYFGDHGGVLPRSKGYVYESGLHVPLVVRVPANFRHLAPIAPGERTEGFVSFVDFGPTLLRLAGLPTPEICDGRPFLGEGVEADELASRDEAFGYADRFDEKYDMARSLRKGSLKYIRNYQAMYPDALQNNYRYRMLAYSEWRELYREGKLDATQRRFFEPKQPEALYDLQSDPYETKNLAGDPEYAEQLLDMRRRLTRRVKDLPDLSFFPESVLVEEAVQRPLEFGKTEAKRIARLVDVADLSLLPFDESRPKLAAAMDSSDPWERYWALICCSVFGEKAAPLTEQAHELLDDEEPLVRVRAAEFLGLTGAADPRPTLYDVLETSESPVVSLLTLNAVVFLADGPRNWDFDFSAHPVIARGDGVQRRLQYLSGRE